MTGFGKTILGVFVLGVSVVALCVPAVGEPSGLNGSSINNQLRIAATMPASLGDSTRVRLGAGPGKVVLLIDAPITSRTVKNGDVLEFRVGYPVKHAGQEYMVIPPGAKAYGVVEEAVPGAIFEGGKLFIRLTEVELGGRLEYTEIGRDVSTNRVPLTFENDLPPVVGFEGSGYQKLRFFITLPVLGFLSHWPEATIGRDAEITALADWRAGSYIYPNERAEDKSVPLPRKTKWGAFKRSLLPLIPINLWYFDSKWLNWGGYYVGAGQDWSGIHSGKNFRWGFGLGVLATVYAQLEYNTQKQTTAHLNKQTPVDVDERNHSHDVAEDWKLARNYLATYTALVYVLNLIDAAKYGGEPKTSKQQNREPAGLTAPAIALSPKSISLAVRW
ncbi:MAG: hypothetical protein O7D32_00040 [bacterium]|nr:hypothetical protein [bacterium]